MRQDPSSFAYTDVGEAREQDAEASYLASLGMREINVNYFEGYDEGCNKHYAFHLSTRRNARWLLTPYSFVIARSGTTWQSRFSLPFCIRYTE